MHSLLKKVFDYLPQERIGIFGSAVENVKAAGDIDVLVLTNDRGFKDLCKSLKVKYNGWDHPVLHYHIRRANIKVPGVDKPVQLVWLSHVSEFEDHEYAILTRDDRIINPGRYYRE